MHRDTVVIVSERSAVRTSLEKLILEAGLNVEISDSSEMWLDNPEAAPAACLLLDLVSDALGSPERITRLAAKCASQRVLVLTDADDVLTAVQAVRQGAAHVVQRGRVPQVSCGRYCSGLTWRADIRRQ